MTMIEDDHSNSNASTHNNLDSLDIHKRTTITVTSVVTISSDDDDDRVPLAAANLLPVDAAAMLFGKGCEGGAHLAALRRTVPRQVVSVIVTQRQEPLKACTTVVGARAIVAVW